MKRSEINRHIEFAKEFFAANHFHLPPWATWKKEEWLANYPACKEILDNKMGWDITDFSGSDFEKRGLILFTLRNGNYEKDLKSYCEKVMVCKEGQETPFHLHWNKMEDMINRGGGVLVFEMYSSDFNGNMTEGLLHIKVDGISRSVISGEPISLNPGQSICLEQGIYHRFYAKPGHGHVLMGEVSAINDDELDNHFLEGSSRFPTIVEDEAPVHYLISDYAAVLR